MNDSEKITIDILKKKINDLEAELKKANQIVTAVDAAGFDIWDNNFVTQDMNGTNERLFKELGYTPDEFPTSLDELFTYIHPVDLEKSLQLANEHFDGKSPLYSSEMRMRAKDGSWVWTGSYGRVVSRNEKGEVTKFTGLSFNIDERRGMEESMRALAYTDSLTNLGNRRILFESGTHEIERAKRYDHPLSMLMLDIDDFKSINDTHGHLVGDDVLTNLADCLMTVIRQVDIKIRYGGDEFVVLLLESTKHEALLTAERLRHAVEQRDFNIASTITISIGVSEMKEEDTLEALIERCDDALYKAKKSGKNQISDL